MGSKAPESAPSSALLAGAPSRCDTRAGASENVEIARESRGARI
jgi:hypothetical protein